MGTPEFYAMNSSGFATRSLFSLLNRGLARNPAERNFESWASILDAKIFSSQNLLVAKFPTAETAVFAVVFLAAGCDLRGKR
jgi:hypothetical protein